MVGMLQIITYLLCLYLVFKALEVLQIAIMSPLEKKTGGLLLGAVLLIVSVWAGFYFMHAIDAQAESVSRHTSFGQ